MDSYTWQDAARYLSAMVACAVTYQGMAMAGYEGQFTRLVPALLAAVAVGYTVHLLVAPSERSP